MGLLLDLQRRTLSDGERSIRFTRHQARILARLANGPVAMSGQGESLEWCGLRVHICTIRKRLRAGGFAPLIANTVGAYHLLVPVAVTGAAVAGVVIPGHMVAALRALLWSHPDEAGAERFLVML